MVSGCCVNVLVLGKEGNAHVSSTVNKYKLKHPNLELLTYFAHNCGTVAGLY